MINFSEKEIAIGNNIFHKFKDGRKNPEWAVMTFEDVFKIVNKKEKELLEKILVENPTKYGKAGPFFGIKAVPKNLIVLKGQKYVFKGEEKITKDQYVPKKVFSAFERMNEAMKADIRRSLNIVSGYRSPAYQMVVFFCNLVENNWNFKKTIQSVALPGWSEHGCPSRQALDVAPARAIAKLENFYRTKEYEWLLKNAKKFGFYLSFPRGNKKGVIFEPWHWHYGDK